MVTAWVVGVLLTQAAPAATAQNDVRPPAPAAADVAAASKDPTADAAQNRKICMREAVTGSNLPQTTVCKTQREWDELRQESREFTERMQTQNRGTVCAPPNKC